MYFSLVSFRGAAMCVKTIVDTVNTVLQYSIRTHNKIHETIRRTIIDKTK